MNVYCGFFRNKILKHKVVISKNFFIKGKCTECNGHGFFYCGIEELNGQCIHCKGTGIEYFGTI